MGNEIKRAKELADYAQQDINQYMLKVLHGRSDINITHKQALELTEDRLQRIRTLLNKYENRENAKCQNGGMYGPVTFDL